MPSGAYPVLRRPEDEAVCEAEVEAVQKEAMDAAEQSSSPGSAECPYPDEDWRADIWHTFYRQGLFAAGWH